MSFVIFLTVHDDQVDAASDAFNELHEGFEAFFADMGFAR